MNDFDTRKFLLTIVQTISTVLLWMMANVFVGIYLNYGFFEDQPSWQNIIYYIAFIVSLLLIIRYVRKKWYPA